MIRIPADIRAAVLRHAVEGLPNEACGLLAGREGKVERVYPMANVDDSPLSYRLDPTEQLRVFNEIEEKGWELVGIYHSHTHTEAYPSEKDRSQAFYPDAHYVVVSLQDPSRPDLRAYAIRDGEVREVPVA